MYTESDIIIMLAHFADKVDAEYRSYTRSNILAYDLFNNIRKDLPGFLAECNKSPHMRWWDSLNELEKLKFMIDNIDNIQRGSRPEDLSEEKIIQIYERRNS